MRTRMYRTKRPMVNKVSIKIFRNGLRLVFVSWKMEWRPENIS